MAFLPDNAPMHTLISFAAPPGPQCRQALERLALPHLRRLLQVLAQRACASGQPDNLTPVHERVRAQSWGLVNNAADGLTPWAALDAHRLGLTTQYGLEGWAWITPCHWNVQAGHVDMEDPQRLALTVKDTDALHHAMQAYFAEDGIQLFPHHLGHPRWLAKGDVFKDLPTASLDRVAAQTVDAWMPRQDQAKSLRRLQNEMQMLLYTHPVNDSRATFRLPSINSFWISGTGTLRQPDALVAPEEHAQRWTERDNLRHAALHDDAPAWMEAWQALDSTTLAHAVQQVEAGQAVQIILCGEHRAVTLETDTAPWWSRMQRRLQAIEPTTFLQTL